jgi:hypothetical protein
MGEIFSSGSRNRGRSGGDKVKQRQYHENSIEGGGNPRSFDNVHQAPRLVWKDLQPLPQFTTNSRARGPVRSHDSARSQRRDACCEIDVTRILKLPDGEELISSESSESFRTMDEDPRQELLEHRRAVSIAEPSRQTRKPRAS